MKLKFNEKYNTIATYCFGVILASMAIFFILNNVSTYKNYFKSFVNIMQPFIIGGVIAYLLNFVLKFYEKLIVNYNILKNKKAIRIFGIILTYITVGIFMIIFYKFVLPQLIKSLSGLANNVPMYLEMTSKFCNNFMVNLNLEEKYFESILYNVENIVKELFNMIANSLPYLGNMLISLTSIILNVFLGIIISVYLLIDKEYLVAMFYKIIYSIFPSHFAKILKEKLQLSNYIFGKFISGKILDSLIIGVLTFIVLYIVKMPYALLISVIVGITNVIPFFGPFIGAVPAGLIILFDSPDKLLLILLIIFLIQQLDGNVIGPKILGDCIGIAPIWILFSILIFSKLIGIVGMIIGVPLFSIIYIIINEVIDNRLKRKGLPVETKKYYE